MDRDRIVEDVGDMDDYFEYERPLDFVSRAERRKILKEAEGDEDRANQLLLERQNKAVGSTEETVALEQQFETEQIAAAEPATEQEPIDVEVVDEEPKPLSKGERDVSDSGSSREESVADKPDQEDKSSSEPPSPLEEKPTAKKNAPPPPDDDIDDLDLLDMDEF